MQRSNFQCGVLPLATSKETLFDEIDVVVFFLAVFAPKANRSVATIVQSLVARAQIFAIRGCVSLECF